MARYTPPNDSTTSYINSSSYKSKVFKDPSYDNYVKANDAVSYYPHRDQLNLGTLPSQIVINPREHVNAITTRSGKTCEGPPTPLVPTPVVSTPPKEPEQNSETSMDRVQKPSSESTEHEFQPTEVMDSIFIEIPKSNRQRKNCSRA
ncbi:hypothetical protein Tco_0732228 [Tanacetum coccineum]